MNKVTAVMLSKEPTQRQLPHGVTLLNYVSTIRDAADHQWARLNSISQVKTPFFFYLDDDDRLPEDFEEILARILALNVSMAYTDEELTNYNEPSQRVRRSGLYSQKKHIDFPQFIHHLTVCKTSHALSACNTIPKGHFWPEMQLYWQLAKRNWAYLPITGYIWNRRSGGLNEQTHTQLGIARSQLWCQANP